MTSEQRIEVVMELAKKVVRQTRENLGSETNDLVVKLETELMKLDEQMMSIRRSREYTTRTNVFEKL